MSKTKNLTQTATLVGFVNPDNEFHTGARSAGDDALVGSSFLQGRTVRLDALSRVPDIGGTVTLRRGRSDSGKGYGPWVVR